MSIVLIDSVENMIGAVKKLNCAFTNNANQKIKKVPNIAETKEIQKFNSLYFLFRAEGFEPSVSAHLANLSQKFNDFDSIVKAVKGKCNG